MGIAIRGKINKKDDLKYYVLHELVHANGEKSLTFEKEHGFEICDFDRLKEIYELIGKTLKSVSREDYDDYLNWFNNMTVEENEKGLAEMGFKKQK